MKRRKFPSSENPRNGDQQQRREGGPPKRHRQLQGMWSCWHEGDKKREQGLALLKKVVEILASQNNNRDTIVATRAQCATTHKMHICRESNNSRIQSKPKTQLESTRMHRAKAAQSSAAQKVANPPKRKVSEESKDAVCEQQNAPHKCNNEYVATKKQVAKDMTVWFPPKTRYKRATRRATSVPQGSIRACDKTRYEHATRRVTCSQSTRFVYKDALHRVRIRRSSRYGGVTRFFTARGSYQTLFTTRGSYKTLFTTWGSYQSLFTIRGS